MRKNTKKVDIIIIAVILLLIAGGILLALLPRNEQQAESVISAELTLSDFNGKRAGITTGSIHDTIINDHLPDSELYEFNNYSDMTAALTSDRIDYFLMTKEAINQLMSENSAIGYIDEPLDHLFVGALFPKTSDGDRIRGQFDDFIADIKADGTLESIYEYWRSSEADGMSVDMSGLTGENGKLIFATNGVKPPVSYVANGNIAGTDPDIAVRFCRKYGYDIEVVVVDTAGIIPGLVSGMFDFAMSDIVITEERKESINFSIPYNTVELYITARKADLTGDPGAVEDRPFSYYAENKKIGALTGGLYEVMIRERYPDAEILQYNNQPDMAVALGAGVIDAFTCPESSAKDFIKADPSLTYLNEVFMEIPYGFAFEKSADKEYLRDQMNEFLAKLRADGTYDDLVSKWFGDDESVKTVDLSGLDGGNGVIRYITAPTMQPFSYIANGDNAGFEVELVARFCREYGYSLNIDNGEFASLIPGITSGMYDIASGTIMITEERAESVNFSDVYYTAHAVAVVRKENTEPETTPGFFESIAESFEKNFIREDRWQLIVEGIGTTCLITVLSTLFGSVLAFLICIFRRTGSRLANAISNIYVKLLQGTPMVVLLMILYYVILGKSGLAAVWVAIIGFTLNFGAYASEIMRSGIESIDGGQREAALALGYNENQAFFRFIFPQAAVRFLPVYNGEIVSLLKSTSIVGYIAIQDLTKMSDIIRSRTYEAFFPLIATAIIYFILAWIISLILKFILKKVSPKRKRG